MRKKFTSLLLITTLAITSLVGCGKKEGLEAYSKEELITAYQTLNTDYTALKKEKEDIEALYNSLNVDSTPVAAIGYVGDATGALTFNSRDAKIIFPATFQYPGAQQVKASGNIYITDDVYVSPGTNWVVKLNGTTLEMEHSNGISGIIKVGSVSTAFGAEQVRTDIIAPWFEGISNEKIVYSDLFSSSSSVNAGTDATVPILIDSEDAFLRCGMACVNGNAITYIFVYRSQQDINKDESIIGIINSITSGGSTLQVNQ